jgi:hypothetical protein
MRDSGAVLLQGVWRDLRHAVRVLSRAPGFTAGALLTLALGIGASAAVFSIVRTVMLEPLPYDRPERIVTIWETARGGSVRNVIAPANFVACRERSRTLEHFGMVEPTGLTVRIDGHPLESSGLSVSADTFAPRTGRSRRVRSARSHRDSSRPWVFLGWRAAISPIPMSPTRSQLRSSARNSSGNSSLMAAHSAGGFAST